MNNSEISLLDAGEGVGDLSYGDGLVVGRVKDRAQAAESFGFETGLGVFQKEAVAENSSAEGDRVDPQLFSGPPGGCDDRSGECVVKFGRDGSGPDP